MLMVSLFCLLSARLSSASESGATAVSKNSKNKQAGLKCFMLTTELISFRGRDFIVNTLI